MIQQIEQAIIAHLGQRETGIFNPYLIRDQVTGKDQSLNDQFQAGFDALTLAGRISNGNFWNG